MREPGVEFSLARGGPLYSLLQRLHLLRPDLGPRWRAAAALSAIGWVPLVFFGAVRVAATGQVPALLLDFSVHARLLVATPLLVISERIIDKRCRLSVDWFVGGTFAGPATREAVAPILRRAERWRDSWGIELLLLLAALASGVSMLSAGRQAGLLFGSSDTGELTALRLWYGVVSLPMYQFLLVRWLFRWGLWSSVLLRFSRLDVRPVTAHPDQAGGLGHLVEPTVGFAVALFGSAGVIASAWAQQILYAGASVDDFRQSFGIVAVIVLVLAFGPLLPFSSHLTRARLEQKREYGKLALRYVRLFDRRWVEQEDDSTLLGSPDLSSLADLISAYQEIGRTRLIPFGVRPVLVVLFALVAPMIPLMATEIPVRDLLLTIAHTLLGGLPI